MRSFTLFFFFTLLSCTTIFSINVDCARGGFRGGGFRGGGAAIRGGGASPRLNTGVNLQNRGNISDFSTNNPSLQNRTNLNRTDIQNRVSNTDYRRNVNVSGNNVNINRNVNVNGNWHGGGWWGGGYYTPPGWGLATFGAGLAIGAALSSPPPYYNNVVVGGTTYLYSDGVYVQPQGSTYVVVKPPVGAVVTYLPDGCSITTTNGTQYYNCSGVLYQPYYQNGNLVYRVVIPN